MKKFLMVLGVIFLCVVLIAVIGFAIAAYNGTKLDKSSKAYVDEAVPAIAASWNAEELIMRASPELLKVMSVDKLDTMFKLFAEKLGALKEYQGSEGDSLVNFSSSGKVITANYIAKAAFEKADAQIRIGIVKHDEKWQLLEFRVNSDALMQ